MSNHEIAKVDPKKGQRLLISYVIGFVLTLALTLIAYSLVMNHALVPQSLYIVLAVLVILQLIVQAVFFFRLNTATENDRWNLIIFLFTLLIMLIVVSGSLWIMYNLNYYMVN